MALELERAGLPASVSGHAGRQRGAHNDVGVDKAGGRVDVGQQQELHVLPLVQQVEAARATWTAELRNANISAAQFAERQPIVCACGKRQQLPWRAPACTTGVLIWEIPETRSKG